MLGYFVKNSLLRGTKQFKTILIMSIVRKGTLAITDKLLLTN